MRNIGYIQAIVFSVFFYSTPVILPAIIFYSYVQLGNSLDASTAFTTIALFNMLQMPFALLSVGSVQYLQSKVSMERILAFLISNELQGSIVKSDALPMTEGTCVKMSDANVSWTGEITSSILTTPQGTVESGCEFNPVIVASGSSVNRAEHTLTNINVDIKHGSLVAIVGTVGSGKSSLLSTILGEVKARIVLLFKRVSSLLICTTSYLTTLSLSRRHMFEAERYA